MLVAQVHQSAPLQQEYPARLDSNGPQSSGLTETGRFRADRRQVKSPVLLWLDRLGEDAAGFGQQSEQGIGSRPVFDGDDPAPPGDRGLAGISSAQLPGGPPGDLDVAQNLVSRGGTGY